MSLVDWLITNGGVSSFDREQMWFAVDLSAIGVLRKNDYLNLLKVGCDEGVYRTKAILAGHWTLSRHEKDALHVLFDYQKRNKQVSLQTLRDAYLSVAQDDKETRSLEKTWKDEHKENRTVDVMKRLKHLLIFVAGVVIGILFFVVLSPMSGNKDSGNSGIDSLQNTGPPPDWVSWWVSGGNSGIDSLQSTGGTSTAESEPPTSNESNQSQDSSSESLGIVPLPDPVYAGDPVPLRVFGIPETTAIFWSVEDTGIVTMTTDAKSRNISLKAEKSGRVLIIVRRDDQNGEIITQLEIIVSDAPEESPASE
jgi:hypothetical protein